MERDGLSKSNPRSFSYRKIVRTAPLGRVVQRERDTQLPRMSSIREYEGENRSESDLKLVHAPGCRQNRV